MEGIGRFVRGALPLVKDPRGAGGVLPLGVAGPYP